MNPVSRLDPARDREGLLALWASCLGQDFPLDARLLDQQLRLERDEFLLLGIREPGSEGLLGAALVKRARRPGPDGTLPSHGNLSFILVAPEARRKGHGSALLEAARAWLRERSASVLHLGRDRYHFFPGAPLDESPGSAALAAFLAARGFVPANEECDLIADLRDLDFPALGKRAPIAPGYAFRLYEPSLLPATKAFFRANFPGRWKDDTMEALEAGMRHADLALLVEEAGGAVVGFARIYDAESTVLGPGVYWRAAMRSADGVLAPGGLGPIGVDESRRGLGLGLGLLRASLEELAARGVRQTMIDWTDLADFYAKLGFRVWKRYRMWSSAL
jgi:GNAT superfamily N-acetyltransferase